MLADFSDTSEIVDKTVKLVTDFVLNNSIAKC